MKKQKTQQDIQINMHNTPILYTDMVLMNVNDDGVIIDICQKGGSNQQYSVVSRVGMSTEHAKKFVKKLSEILALAQTSGKHSEEQN